MEVQAIFDKIKTDHGRIDVSCDIRGQRVQTPAPGIPLAHWQAVIDANLSIKALCCRAVIGMMKNQKWGAVVELWSDIAFAATPDDAHMQPPKPVLWA